MRVNAGLTFYGINRFNLNAGRNDALEVAGPITLNKVQNNAATLTGSGRHAGFCQSCRRGDRAQCFPVAKQLVHDA